MPCSALWEEPRTSSPSSHIIARHEPARGWKNILPRKESQQCLKRCKEFLCLGDSSDFNIGAKEEEIAEEINTKASTRTGGWINKKWTTITKKTRSSVPRVISHQAQQPYLEHFSTREFPSAVQIIRVSRDNAMHGRASKSHKFPLLSVIFSVRCSKDWQGPSRSPGPTPWSRRQPCHKIPFINLPRFILKQSPFLSPLLLLWGCSRTCMVSIHLLKSG